MVCSTVSGVRLRIAEVRQPGRRSSRLMTVSDALVGGIIVPALSTACATASTSPLQCQLVVDSKPFIPEQPHRTQRPFASRESRRSCGPEVLRTSGAFPQGTDLCGPALAKIRASEPSFGGGTSDAFRREHDQQNRLHWPDELLLSARTVSPAWAQAETITATASVRNASGAATSAPLTVVVDRFATDAERDSLLAAVKSGRNGGRTGAPRQAAGRRNAVQLGSQRVAVKYAYARNAGSGRLITVITAQPIGGPDAKPKPGFDLGLALLELTASGPGHGELSPAAKVRIDGREPSSPKAPPLPTPCGFRTSPK